MLYRNFHGKMVNIDKKDFFTDSAYYAKIISTIFNKKIEKPNNTLDRIKNMIK